MERVNPILALMLSVLEDPSAEKESVFRLVHLSLVRLTLSVLMESVLRFHVGMSNAVEDVQKVRRVTKRESVSLMNVRA